MKTLVALTVQDAERLEAPQLQLVHRRLTAVPAGVQGLTKLTSLDLSDNPIKVLQPQHLPVSLKELTLAGCQLSGSLPCSLIGLTALEQLVLPANSITEADAVFSCQNLVHAGLAYNQITALLDGRPAGRDPVRLSSAIRTTGSSIDNVLKHCPIMSLDLSHNDITDLQGTLQQLRQLPKLQALHLCGNPVSLLPHYRASVLQQLPSLVYFDGQKLAGARVPLPSTATPSTEQAACSTPDGSPAPGTGQAHNPSQQGSAEHCCSDVTPCSAAAANAVSPHPVSIGLELDKLQLSDSADTLFSALTAGATAELQKLLLQQGAADGWPNTTAASSAGTAPSTAAAGLQSSPDRGVSSSGTAQEMPFLQPAVPLMAIRYHLQLSAPDGAGLCSGAMVVQPPSPAGGAAGACSTPAGATTAASATDTKKASMVKGAKTVHQDTSKSAATGKGRPGSSMRPSAVKTAGAAVEVQPGLAAIGEAGAAATTLQPGRLRVRMQVEADVATRDWLRSGFDVTLVRTHYKPQPTLSTPPCSAATVDTPGSDSLGVTQAAQPDQPAAAAAPNAAKPAAASQAAKHPGKSAVGNNSSGASLTGSTPQGSRLSSSSGAAASSTGAGAEGPTIPSVTWEQVLRQEQLGTARVVASALLDGNSTSQQHLEVTGNVLFMPPAPLLHPATHIRLSLVEAKQLQKPAAGSCMYRLMLNTC